jgi:hypothetical protein
VGAPVFRTRKVPRHGDLLYITLGGISNLSPAKAIMSACVALLGDYRHDNRANREIIDRQDQLLALALTS